MNADSDTMPKVLRIYLELSNYPILAEKLRERMRNEIFARGVISPEQFEREVAEKAELSQQREGIFNPMIEEPPNIWRKRLSATRDVLTDFYFAYNIPHSRFEEIVRQGLADRTPNLDMKDVVLTFNPELAPWDLLFAQAEHYESLPPDELQAVSHHLKEIKVVLIKAMISDHLAFVGVAKEIFTILDLQEIKRRRFGRGKIGGKSAGMLLAYKILQKAAAEEADEDIVAHVRMPESYYIGSDVHYEFYNINELHHHLNQKYRPADEIAKDFPHIEEAWLKGKLPSHIVDHLCGLLKDLGHTPIIVRSSSLLEDNFGMSFAGKYESIFLPNQGSVDENLDALMQAVKRVYASALSPDALLYRQNMGLVDYDERMAILLQPVEGMNYGNYYFPSVSGVAFSRNPFRWNKRIRTEDGFLRLVTGLGTRAVERVDNDYPRMVALSHPQLRPDTNTAQMRKYSQHFMDLIDLKQNQMVTRAVQDTLDVNYPFIKLLASEDMGDHLRPIMGMPMGLTSDKLVLSFDQLLADTRFIKSMKKVLKRLEHTYQCPVDIEFTVGFKDKKPHPDFEISVLQCRPLSSTDEWRANVVIPRNVHEKDILFRSCGLVPQGIISDINYIVYADPIMYDKIRSPQTRLELGRIIGRLNKRLEGTNFVLMGPGRWGTSNIELGIKVSYADIYNTRALIEIALSGQNGTPELSFGTHFFHDLVEAHIFPIPLLPDEPGSRLNLEFIGKASNILAELLPEESEYASYIKVIDVEKAAEGRKLDIVMNSSQEEALAYIKEE